MTEKSTLVKLILTIPALFLGIYNLILLILRIIGNVFLFILRVTGIMFVLRPVEELWSKPEPKPKPIVDRQEDHDFH